MRTENYELQVEKMRLIGDIAYSLQLIAHYSLQLIAYSLQLTAYSL